MSDSTTAPVAETRDRRRPPNPGRRGRLHEDAKTIVVQTVTRVPHAKFGKDHQAAPQVLRATMKRASAEGEPSASRDPSLSKLKRWKLVEVLKH